MSTSTSHRRRARVSIVASPGVRSSARRFSGLGGLAFASAVLLACGGADNKPAATAARGAGSDTAAAGDPTGSGGAAASSAGAGGDTAGGGTASSGGSGAAASGPTTTTTTTLGKGGDLTGAKLTSSSSSTVEVKSGGGAKPDPNSSEPGRSREDIQTRVAAVRDEARKCYDDALKTHPGIEGDLDVKWVIDPKGVVTDVQTDDAKSQIHEAQLSACVSNLIKKLKFPESAKGLETRTHYPFNFHPRAGSTKK